MFDCFQYRLGVTNHNQSKPKHTFIGLIFLIV